MRIGTNNQPTLQQPKSNSTTIETCRKTEKMKRLFFDMDGVLVNFESGLEQVDAATKLRYIGRPEDIPGLFSLMLPLPGAIEAVNTLAKHYEVFILSTAPWKNPSAWADKRTWITRYFGDLFYKRIILSHRKDLCLGDYLIDDRDKHGASEFPGEWIQFGSSRFPDWETVITYLSEKDHWAIKSH